MISTVGVSIMRRLVVGSVVAVLALAGIGHTILSPSKPPAARIVPASRPPSTVPAAPSAASLLCDDLKAMLTLQVSDYRDVIGEQISLENRGETRFKTEYQNTNFNGCEVVKNSNGTKGISCKTSAQAYDIAACLVPLGNWKAWSSEGDNASYMNETTRRFIWVKLFSGEKNAFLLRALAPYEPK